MKNCAIGGWLLVLLSTVIGMAGCANPLRTSVLDKQASPVQRAVVSVTLQDKAGGRFAEEHLTAALWQTLNEELRILVPEQAPWMRDNRGSGLMGSAAHGAPEASHRLVVEAAIIEYSKQMPMQWDSCAFKDKQKACVGTMVGGGFDPAKVRVNAKLIDLRRQRTVFEIDPVNSAPVSAVDNSPAELARPVAYHLVSLLRDNGLLRPATGESVGHPEASPINGSPSPADGRPTLLVATGFGCPRDPSGTANRLDALAQGIAEAGFRSLSFEVGIVDAGQLRREAKRLGTRWWLSVSERSAAASHGDFLALELTDIATGQIHWRHEMPTDSSPEALAQTIREALRRLAPPVSPAAVAEEDSRFTLLRKMLLQPPDPPGQRPGDFAIRYEETTSSPQMPRYAISIDSAGKSEFGLSLFGRKPDGPWPMSFALDSKALDNLYTALRGQGAFSRYWITGCNSGLVGKRQKVDIMAGGTRYTIDSSLIARGDLEPARLVFNVVTRAVPVEIWGRVQEAQQRQQHQGKQALQF